VTGQDRTRGVSKRSTYQPGNRRTGMIMQPRGKYVRSVSPRKAIYIRPPEEHVPGWVILPHASIETCIHTCNLSESCLVVARCLFGDKLKTCLFCPLREVTVTSWDSCSLGAGGTFRTRYLQSRPFLDLLCGYLQVGLVRNGSGNDHIVVRDKSASTAGCSNAGRMVECVHG